MTQSAFPESRVYRHGVCNTDTEISGQAFESLSNPFTGLNLAWCGSCKAHFPLSEFAWADTDERITDYYLRHTARATVAERFLSSRLFLVILAAVGFLGGGSVGLLLFHDKTWVVKAFIATFVGGVGVFIFVSVQDFLVNRFLIWRVCGVNDARSLK